MAEVAATVLKKRRGSRQGPGKAGAEDSFRFGKGMGELGAHHLGQMLSISGVSGPEQVALVKQLIDLHGKSGLRAAWQA